MCWELFSTLIMDTLNMKKVMVVVLLSLFCHSRGSQLQNGINSDSNPTPVPGTYLTNDGNDDTITFYKTGEKNEICSYKIISLEAQDLMKHKVKRAAADNSFQVSASNSSESSQPPSNSSQGKVSESVITNVKLDSSDSIGSNGNHTNATKVPFKANEMYPTVSIPFDLKPWSEHFEQDVKEHNLTLAKPYTENHKYYKSTFYPKGMQFWADLDKLNGAEKHDMLSQSHRRAATFPLKFSFPFFGHDINNLIVTTGGFIFVGDQVHDWLAATQYIAPLMANLESRNSTNATLKYYSGADQFTAEWGNFFLKDSASLGTYTFQTSLYKNGTIAFVYKDIPIPPEKINDTAHPVKIGLSDAYVTDRRILSVLQKTIYEYARVNLKGHDKYEIRNRTAIILDMLPTCAAQKSCFDCTNMTKRNGTEFNCAWCHSLERCSDGKDRFIQNWIENNCNVENNVARVLNKCVLPNKADEKPSPKGSGPERNERTELFHDKGQKQDYEVTKEKVFADSHGMSTGGVIGVLILVMLIVASVGWGAYAYMRPHSPSGQFLIRYRPTHWGPFRRGEARYTAASIHM